jgi:hypothetical protein
MFICANATRGLAQYRALKSRLHPLVTLVEAYEVLKIANSNLTKALADYKKSFCDEILEWNGQTMQEEPIVSR